MTAVRICDLSLVGTNHHDFKNSALPTSAMQLVAEPQNIHDDHAVVAMFNDKKVGYIARGSIQMLLHRLLAAGVALHALIDNSKAALYGQVTVSIFVQGK